MKIKFGTDGWRAVIAQEFTVNNVARVTLGVAQWLNKNFKNPSVVIGHDCRFGGSLFAKTSAIVFNNFGIKVILADKFVTTPMLSLGVLEYNASLGVVITASHNPYEYNGYKLKGNFGGPLLTHDVQAIRFAKNVAPYFVRYFFYIRNTNSLNKKSATFFAKRNS